MKWHTCNKERKICFIPGLETFISIAKLLPSAEQYDVVEGYIKISVECAEIFKLLDGERRPESEVSISVSKLDLYSRKCISSYDLQHNDNK